jgi:hypothetical protein
MFRCHLLKETQSNAPGANAGVSKMPRVITYSRAALRLITHLRRVTAVERVGVGNAARSSVATTTMSTRVKSYQRLLIIIITHAVQKSPGSNKRITVVVDTIATVKNVGRE